MAEEIGISRATAYRWVNWCRNDGLAGLQDCSFAPGSCSYATPRDKTAEVLVTRPEHRSRHLNLALRTGVGARAVLRILARAGMPKLWDLDPLTVIRTLTARATDCR